MYLADLVGKVTNKLIKSQLIRKDPDAGKD